MLPQEVLQRAAEEMLSFGSSGQSVMEMSHRSREYEEIIASCESRLRSVMGIPDNYKVLFLQGGASLAFDMIPQNFMSTGKADYVVSGQFSKKAYDEAKLYGDAAAIASSKDQNFTYVPRVGKDDLRPGTSYLHICFNNTIYGTKYNYIPDTGDVPLIADVSSCVLSEPIDVSKFAMLYAGAQKNMSMAGLTVAIIREDLLGRTPEGTPSMLSYKLLSENDSMYNTPPCYAIYICGLVLEWIESIGGLEAMKRRNEEKAKILYDYLDGSKLFKAPVQKEHRSMMNVTFVTGSDELDNAFVKACKEEGLVNIKGHRSVGGMRASIYNAMPREGVQHLVEVMRAFEAANLQ